MCPPECFVFLVTVSRVSSQVPFESLTSFKSSLPCKLELTAQSIEHVIVAGLFFASETFLFCFSSSLNNSLQLLFYFLEVSTLMVLAVLSLVTKPILIKQKLMSGFCVGNVALKINREIILL